VFVCMCVLVTRVVAIEKCMFLCVAAGVCVCPFIYVYISANISVLVSPSVCLCMCRSQVSTWSSGTGAAGVAGALSYAGLTALKVSPRTTLLMMLVIPGLLFLTSVGFIHDSTLCLTGDLLDDN